MNVEIFCPICKNKNLIDAAKCDFCGAPFKEGRGEPITTLPVGGPQPDLIIKSSQHIQELAKYPADALVLFIMDEEQPLVIRGTSKVVLGRNISNIPPVVFDLSDYGAAELGVSRQHAMILVVNGAFRLTDLGSTNGTWLNTGRLVAQKPYALRSGDQVRLGNLRMFVYFRTGEESPGATEEIILLAEEPRASATLHPRVTAHYLSTAIYPYMQAMVELQAIVEECHRHHPREVIINTISAMRQDLPIGISITGASQAIGLVKRVIIPWKQERHYSSAASSNQSALPADDTSQTNPHATRIIGGSGMDESVGRHVTPVAQEDLLRLAQEIIDNVAPDLSTLDKRTFTARIMPAVSVLVSSRLQILQDKPTATRQH